MKRASIFATAPHSLALAAGLIAAALVGAVTPGAAHQGPRAGSVPPEINALAVDGRRVSLAALKGKVVLVDFWATWCPPCVEEMPRVLALYNRYHPQGLELVGVSRDAPQDRQKILAFAREQRLPWPQVHDTTSQYARAYGLQFIPFTVLLGRNGRIFATNLRGERLEAAVQAALNAPAPEAARPATAPGAFALDAEGAQQYVPSSDPVQVALKSEKPAAVRKEPAYRAAPRYATVRVGNGPNAEHVVALDEPAQGDWKIYVDVNRNGDLTDDRAGDWQAKQQVGGQVLYGVNTYVLRASWGTPANETGSGRYGLAFSRLAGQNTLSVARRGARVGTVTLDGKSHRAALVENDGDALFAKPLDDAGKPVGGGPATRPVFLLIDLDDDRKFVTRGNGIEMFDARQPFAIGGRNFEASVAPDGSSVKVSPTTRKVVNQTP